MTPVIPCSTSNIFLVPGAAFSTRKNDSLARCYISRKSTKRVSNAQDSILSLTASIRLFPNIRTCGLKRQPRFKIVTATGIDVAVEQPDSPVEDKESGEALEATSADKSNEESSVKAKRTRPGRKSEMLPVKNEDLVPGATFTGKVRSIQPFGAFIDFGAFTDGLVHVSRLSDSFVKDVGTVVSVGQEVKVRLVEANTETGRISLTMREGDDVSKLKDGPADSDKRPPRRNSQKSNQRREEGKKTSKFVKGQILQGTVKNLTRAGAFISLPEGEEGFLPTSEEADDGLGNIMGGTSLEAGQEVEVRVLRLSRGQATLTMKKEEDFRALDSKLQGTVHTATNPFLLAFRKNKDIAAFLDERDKEEDTTETPEGISSVPSAVDEKVDQDEVSEGKVDDKPESSISDALESVESVNSAVEIDDAIIDEAQIQKPSEEPEISSPPPVEDEKVEVVADDKSSITSEEEIQTPVEESIVSFLKPGENEKAKDDPDEISSITSSNRQIDVPLSQEITKQEGISSVPSAVDEKVDQDEVSEGKVDIKPESSVSDVLESVESVNSAVEIDDAIIDEVQVQTPSEEPEISSPPPVEDEKVEVVADDKSSITSEGEIQTPVEEVSSLKPVEDEKAKADPGEISSITSSNGQIDVPLSQKITNQESQRSESVENQINTTPKDEVQILTPVDAEIPSSPEQDVSVTNSNGQSSTPAPLEATTKAAISAALVKQLREESGAGMMDCKKALSETGGDIVKAQEYLRKKGLASAEKKASRATAEGRIGSYIHDSRIGILIEVNCETDFVSRGEIFKELVDDLAMQVAACPQVQYLVTDEVPKEMVEKEREIEMQKEDLSSKPEHIRSKIVDGRIRKRLEELALLEQPYIKNDKVVVKDFVKQTIATIGENIKVKRFVRFNLGEGLEKKSQDFAAEVAAQTSAKPVATPAKEQLLETKETDEKPPKPTVSAALVKQLREETGAGMMDCKKALSETGGDLEKAQEYLRKKGLSTADKKSSRLAAEGRIGSYIHDSRIGVLIEINCETDFVGRSEKFKELVDDLAMQVVACPKVEYVSVDDIPVSIVSKEKELEMQREDILSKPENIRERIVAGRVSKRLGELALLEQPFIKDDSILVKDLVKQTVAAIGENIKVRRFVRFTLGEESDAKTETEA